MQLLTVLNAIENIETAVGGLYRWFSDLYEDDAEASGFFFRMSMQENSHASMVAFSKSLVRRSPAEFPEIEFDFALVDDLIARIAAFKGRKTPPSLDEALAFAIEVEAHGAEGIHRTAVIQSNPQIADVINNLATADQVHAKNLSDFAARRAKGGKKA